MTRPAPQPADRAPGTAVLVALGWGAFVVAANGFLSLLTGLEVVPLHGAGPLVGPVAIAVALLLLLGRLLLGGRSGWLVLECGVLVYLALLLVGALGYLLVRGAPADGLLYLSSAALSPFTLVETALALVGGFLFVLVVRARAAGAGTPRWPWERDDGP